MAKEKKVPVYLFKGFLDSGKTSFIRETIEEGQFEDKMNYLIIFCEEGEIEIEAALLDKYGFKTVSIEDEEEVNSELFASYKKAYEPDCVIIESNGMWDVNEILEALPEDWLIAETVTTVDCTTFESYLNNMKMMMTNQFLDADLVLFNRCAPEHDRAMFKRMVRAVNRFAQVLYETTEGEVSDDAHEEPPYDKSAPHIEVGDDDFGIFYLDALENLDDFKGKTVTFKGQVYHPKGARDDVFVPGRNAMTCCVEDISFVGFPCKYAESPFLKDKDWVMVTAKIGSAPSKQMGGEAPVLFATKVAPADKPEEELILFN